VDERDGERPPGGDAPRQVPEDPPTEQVRVVGAVRVGLPPEEPEDAGPPAEDRAAEEGPEEAAAGVAGQPSAAERAAPLPHWTDPPTGQVPAVVARSEEPDDPLAGRPGEGPAWREQPHEWDDRPVAAELLADAELRVGSLRGAPEQRRDDGEGPGSVAGERRADGVDRPSEKAGAKAVGRPPLSPREHAGGVRGRRGQARREQPARQAGRSGRNLPMAVASGAAFGLVALGCMAAGPLATCLLAAAVLTAAAAEAYAALQRAGYRPATLVGLVATAGSVLAAYAAGVAAIPLVLAAAVVVSFLWYLFGAGRGSVVTGIGTTLLPVVWVGTLGSFAGLLLAPSIFPDRHGVAFFLGVLVAVVGVDVGGLGVGSLLGRHRLAPEVSPGKSWEGALGGAALALLLSGLVVSRVHPWTLGSALALGGLAAVLAPLGDLCESLVKRDLGLKDMGGLLPGHGGLLDRFDGVLFVLPAAYYLVRALHVG